MLHNLASAYQHYETYGIPPDLTFDLVRDYFQENNYKVQNIALVKDFQFFLVKTESQERNRKLFREYVDRLSEMKKDLNGEKFLVLKEEFRIRAGPKRSNTTVPNIGNRLSNRFSSPTTDFLSPMSPPSGFYSDGSPILPTKLENSGPPLRVTVHQPVVNPSLSLPSGKKGTKYPSPNLPLRSDSLVSNSRTSTPTLINNKARHELTSFMPHGLRTIDTMSLHSSEADHSSMDFSRNLEHAWVTACVTGNDDQINRMLLEDSNFCHYQDYIYGYTGLHWAAKRGRLEILASLLMAGADVNVRSFGGHTPLHLAAQVNQEKVIEYFVNQCDADVDSRDNYGKPPSDYLPDNASKRSKYWLRRQHNTSIYSPLHYNPQNKETKNMFGSQGELSGLERTASRIRVSFRRKSKAMSLQRSNTAGMINSSC